MRAKLKQKKLKKKLAWAIIFICAISISVGIYLYSTLGMTDTVKDQLSAIQSGDIEKAYSYTSSEFQKASSLDVFKSYVDHYPQLKDNAGLTFSDKQRNGNEAILIGTLKSKEGEMVSVEYRMMKESGKWKIAFINLGDVARGSTANGGLENVYKNAGSHYTLRYPGNWGYETIPNDKTIFSGAKGTSSNNSFVAIQAIDPTSLSQSIQDTSELKNLLIKQVRDSSTNFKIIHEGDVVLATNPKKFYGQYFIATYTFDGAAYKKMQCVLQRIDGNMYYSWSYISTSDQFDADLPTVKAMFESWEID